MESHTRKPHTIEEVFDKLKAHFTDKTIKLDEFCSTLIDRGCLDSIEMDSQDMEEIGMPWHIINVAFQIHDGSYRDLTPEDLTQREQQRKISVNEVLEQSQCYSEQLVQQFEAMMVTTTTDVFDMQKKQWDSLGLSPQQIESIKNNSVLLKPGSDVTLEEVFIEAIKRYNEEKKLERPFADFQPKFEKIGQYAQNAAELSSFDEATWTKFQMLTALKNQIIQVVKEKCSQKSKTQTNFDWQIPESQPIVNDQMTTIQLFEKAIAQQNAEKGQDKKVADFQSLLTKLDEELHRKQKKLNEMSEDEIKQVITAKILCQYIVKVLFPKQAGFQSTPQSEKSLKLNLEQIQPEEETKEQRQPQEHSSRHSIKSSFDYNDESPQRNQKPKLREMYKSQSFSQHDDLSQLSHSDRMEPKTSKPKNQPLSHQMIEEEPIRLPKRKDIIGPRLYEQGESDPRDIKQIENALINLRLQSKMEKKQARLCLFQKVKNVCEKDRDRELMFQILVQNPNAVDIQTSIKIRTQNDSHDRHPLDVLFDIYLASSDEVREMIAQILFNSNRAIPFMLPYRSKPQLCLWQLFNLRKEWRMGDEPSDVKNERVYKYQAPIVSFIKLGTNFKVSKSEAINRIFFEGSNRVFLEAAFTTEMQKFKSIGLIDLAFAGPELSDYQPRKPDLPDLVTILNLHGDGNDLHDNDNNEKTKTIIEFLKEISNLIVVFPESPHELAKIKFNETNSVLVVHKFNESAFQYIQDPKPINRDEFNYSKLQMLVANQQFFLIKTKINGLLKQQQEQHKIKNCQKTCSKAETDCREHPLYKCLEEIGEMQFKKQPYVDLQEKHLKQAKNDAENLFDDIIAHCKVQTIAEVKQIDENQAKVELLKELHKQPEDIISDKLKNQDYNVVQALKSFFSEKIEGGDWKFKSDLERKKYQIISEKFRRKFDDVEAITNKQITLGGSRSRILKLQTKELSEKFAKLYKQVEKQSADKSLKDKLRQEKTNLEDEIVKKIESEILDQKPKSFIMRFVDYLVDNRIDQNKIDRFLDYFGYLLDSINEDEMHRLRDNYSKHVDKLKKCQSEGQIDKAQLVKLQDEEKALANRINTESFGREHFFREFGLIYYFAADIKDKQGRKVEYWKDQTYQIVKQMIKGYAIELMDGDNSFIWTNWINAVLDNMKEKLKKKLNKEPKGIIMSIMGLQSSGKSTMLNSMFNLKFAVAAGRCTKGIYMLPVILDEELRKQKGFDFILIFDTEGLRAMELGISNNNRAKDNEMATTCVATADLTLINSMRMQNTELFELLGIVVHAILRFKKDQPKDNRESFKASALFCNQGMDPSKKLAVEVGSSQRQKFLNDITLKSAEAVGFNEDERKFLTFNSLITQAISEQFIETLFADSGNRKRFSAGYIRTVQQMKHTVLEEFKTIAQSGTLDRIWKKIKIVYQAIILDDFAFSFKNEQDIIANKKAQSYFMRMKYEITKNIQLFFSRLDKDVLNLKIEEIESKVADEQIKTYENLCNEFKKWIQEEKEKCPEIKTQEELFLKKFNNFVEEEFKQQSNTITKKKKSKLQLKILDEWSAKFQEEMIKEMQQLKRENRLPEKFEDFWKEKEQQKMEEIEEIKRMVQVDCFEEYTNQFNKFFSEFESSGLLRFQEYTETENPDQTNDEFLKWFKVAAFSGLLLTSDSESDVSAVEFIKKIQEDLEAIYDKTENEIETSKNKLDQAILNKTTFHQIFVQCKIKIDESERKMSHPVLTDIFYPSIIHRHMKPLIERFKELNNMSMQQDELELKLKGEIKKQVQVKFDTVLQGLSVADSITKDITKNLEENWSGEKGFLSKIELKLENFFKDKFEGNDQLFPKNKQTFIYYTMKKILEESKDYQNDQEKNKNFVKQFNLSWQFEQQFDDYIKTQTTKTLEIERKLRLKNIRENDKTEMFMNNYLIKEYKFDQKDGEIIADEMAARLTCLFETGKGKGDQLCNFFVEDHLKEFVSLWSGLLEKLHQKIKIIGKELVKNGNIGNLFEEKQQCAKHLKTWHSEVTEEVQKNHDQKVTLNAIELNQVESCLVIQQIYEQAKMALQSLVKKVNFQDYTISKDQIEKVREDIKEQIAGCQETCKMCKAICTETEKNHTKHKSDFHAYPALTGWKTPDGQLMNDDTCETIVYNDYKIQHPVYRNEISARQYFEQEHWIVDQKAALMNEDKDAFWKWVLLHFKINYEKKYSTNMKQDDKLKWKLYRSAEQHRNEENTAFDVALRYIASQLDGFAPDDEMNKK